MGNNQSRLAWGWTKAVQCVSIDTRALAVFRAGVALLILGDLISRARNFGFYYTNDGVVTEELAREWTGGAFSFFYFVSDPVLIAALFVIHGLIAVQLLVGYKTRMAVILSFLFVISLDHHNPYVLSYADTLFRLLLFWAIFLPLGERWSIDSVHRERSPRRVFVGVASAFILGQMVLMYLANAAQKHVSDLWRTGEAAPLVFALDEMTFLLGDPIRRTVPLSILEVGGFLWFLLLIVSPLLIVLSGRWRMPLLCLFMGGHLSFAVTVRIGAFAYVALAGLILFVQTPVWNDLRWLLERVGGRPLYDAVSWWGSRVARSVPRLESVRRITATDRVRQRREDIALLALSFLIVVAGISLAMISFAYAGALHDGVPEYHDELESDSEVRAVTAIQETSAAFGLSALGVNQPSWTIFAPEPRTTDRYYVFAAETVDGEHLDVYFDRELSYERPYQELQNQHGAYRERFYMNAIQRANESSELPRRLADYHCERYEEQGIQLVRLNMYVIEEPVTLETVDDPTDRDREIHLLHKFSCLPGEDPREFAPPPDA